MDRVFHLLLLLPALSLAGLMLQTPTEGNRYLSPDNTSPCKFAGNVSTTPLQVIPGSFCILLLRFVSVRMSFQILFLLFLLSLYDFKRNFIHSDELVH